MKLSIVIPVYNEKETIHELYRRLQSALRMDFEGFDYEIIFVDDGSSDNSFDTLTDLHKKDKNVKVLQFSRNFGHHNAITAGLDIAQGDFVVMMDGDLQDQPEEIINLYNKLKQGFDVVYAERVSKKFSLTKRTFSRMFNFVIRKLIDEEIVINSTIFRIMTKQVVNNIRKLKERNRYLVGIIGWVGFKHASCKVEHGTRFKGKTKYSLSKLLGLALNAVFSFSDYPLRLVLRIGFLFVFLSILMTLYIIYKKIVYNIPVLGWSSLITSIFIIGGVQIIILGIIGQYLGRNYIESKNRPLYIIKTSKL